MVFLGRAMWVGLEMGKKSLLNWTLEAPNTDWLHFRKRNQQKYLEDSSNGGAADSCSCKLGRGYYLYRAERIESC